jgi:hypothetical protein
VVVEKSILQLLPDAVSFRTASASGIGNRAAYHVLRSIVAPQQGENSSYWVRAVGLDWRRRNSAWRWVDGYRDRIVA